MAAQGERVFGAIVMCNVLDPMAQDESPEQDIVVEEQELPQTNPKPEMGAAAAAVYDTPPSPTLSKSFPSPQRNRDRPRRFGFVGVG